MTNDLRPEDAPPDRKLPQHGVNGVYYGGEWLDIEDCATNFSEPTCPSGENYHQKCLNCPRNKDKAASLRSSGPTALRSRSFMDASLDSQGITYDIAIIGAGCIGSAIARELSKYKCSVILLEAADDISQGATKGNSGIVHAGYDDKPNTNRSKFCWPGNQMFEALDKELRFGYQKNGSLVIATSSDEVKVLHELKQRGLTNGVQNLKILNKDDLHAMEPAINPDAIGALYSPDAGNVIPYEYAIALAENAVDNGVEVRIRREILSIKKEKEDGKDRFVLNLNYWEPQSYVDVKSAQSLKAGKGKLTFQGLTLLSSMVMIAMGTYMTLDTTLGESARHQASMATLGLVVAGFIGFANFIVTIKRNAAVGSGEASIKLPMEKLVEQCPTPSGNAADDKTAGNRTHKVQVSDMFTGGSGSRVAMNGVQVAEEVVKASYVINCAGGGSDIIARMIGDDTFKIKPRLGDYLLLNRNQGHLTSKTIFPCPDPILGKGVLVQTTLWGNLILGPTARDTYKPEARDMSDASVQEYILSKCKKLIPYFDPKETFHAFCGARAKSDRGDWIIERSCKDGNFVHVAGIDSPGLAASPAIAVHIISLLKEAGLTLQQDPSFQPNRAPIITPKRGMRGLKMGKVGKNDYKGAAEAKQSDEDKRMASNVICKCEKVTELEVVRAIRRSLPIDSTQAIRKRTRAGMGHCQGDKNNYNCESRVKAIIARENGVPIEEVGGRPWPATSTLPQRWISDGDRNDLVERMNK